MVIEKREWIIIIIVAFISGLIIGNYSSKINNQKIVDVSPLKEKIYVHIDGEIKNPGVYEMENGDRVFQLLEKAGGITENGDLSSINLSKKLIDGEKIIIFAKKAPENEINLSNEANIDLHKDNTAKSNLININTADQKTLEELPGIGPTLAQRIIEYREKNGYFQSIEDIKKVSGIGEKRFEDIKDLITVGP